MDLRNCAACAPVVGGVINSSKVLKDCFYNVRFLSNKTIIIDNIQKYNYLFVTDENYLTIFEEEEYFKKT